MARICACRTCSKGTEAPSGKGGGQKLARPAMVHINCISSPTTCTRYLRDRWIRAQKLMSNRQGLLSSTVSLETRSRGQAGTREGRRRGGEAVPLLALAGLSRTQFYFLPFPVPRCHVSIATVLAQGALPPLACFQIYNFSPLVRPACLCHFPVPSPLTASPLAIPHFPPIFCTIQFSNGQKNQCGEKLL